MPSPAPGLSRYIHGVQVIGDLLVTETPPAKVLYLGNALPLLLMISNDASNDLLPEFKVTTRSDVLPASADLELVTLEVLENRTRGEKIWAEISAAASPPTRYFWWRKARLDLPRFRRAI
jgi:hypothetical protein